MWEFVFIVSCCVLVGLAALGEIVVQTVASVVTGCRGYRERARERRDGDDGDDSGGAAAAAVTPADNNFEPAENPTSCDNVCCGDSIFYRCCLLPVSVFLLLMC